MGMGTHISSGFVAARRFDQIQPARWLDVVKPPHCEGEDTLGQFKPVFVHELAGVLYPENFWSLHDQLFFHDFHLFKE